MVSPDAVWVIDFKSHSTTDPEALAHHAEGYRKQMGAYARYARMLYPERAVRCSLLFTRSRLLHDLPDV